MKTLVGLRANKGNYEPLKDMLLLEKMLVSIETYITVELLNSSLSFFDRTHSHKSKSTTLIGFPIVDNLQPEESKEYVMTKNIISCS